MPDFVLGGPAGRPIMVVMQLNPRALVPLAICVAVMMLVLTARRSSVADLAVNLVGWGILAALSAVGVWKMVRRRSLTPYNQADSMPERIRRWVLGESRDHPR